MGTDTTRQRGGIGLRRHPTAMARAQQDGATRYSLGAMPAGYRLHEGLGYTTRVTTQIWASGETSQA